MQTVYRADERTVKHISMLWFTLRQSSYIVKQTCFRCGIEKKRRLYETLSFKNKPKNYLTQHLKLSCPMRIGGILVRWSWFCQTKYLRWSFYCQWRIQDFSEGPPTPKMGVPTYYMVNLFSKTVFCLSCKVTTHDNYALSFEETIWSSTYAMATLKHRWQEEVTNWKDHLKLYTWIASFQHAEGRSANVICSAVRSKKGNGVKKLLLLLHCMKYSFVSLCSDVSTSSTRGSKVFVHLPLAVM